MKTFAAALVTVISLMSVGTAQAKDLPLIEMSGEGCKVKLPLGVQISEKDSHKIEGIYYRDDNNVRQFFSSEKLAEMTVVYLYKKKYQAASLKLTPVNRDLQRLTIKFLRNGIKDTYDTIELRLAYNAHTNQYEAIDPETNRPVTQAHIVPNKVVFIGMVGILDLQLR